MTCEVDWGICPVHGQTLRESGGVTWCSVPLCTAGPDEMPAWIASGQADGMRHAHGWTGHRLEQPCTEPARYVATDPTGAEMRICRGHRIALQERMSGAWTIRPLAAAPVGTRA